MAAEQRNRAWVARVFTAVEDVVYVGLGLLLAGCSLALLISGLISFGQNLMAGSLTSNIVAMLDRVLLILLVVELLYTVQVSFREHALMPEPFLLIGSGPDERLQPVELLRPNRLRGRSGPWQ